MRPLSAVIAWARSDGVLRSANTVQVGNNRWETRQVPAGAGTIQSRFAPNRQSQFTTTVRRTTALSRSRRHSARVSRRPGADQLY